MYGFAFPALVAKPAWEVSDDGWVEAQSTLGVDAVSLICFREIDKHLVSVYTRRVTRKVTSALLPCLPVYDYIIL